MAKKTKKIPAEKIKKILDPDTSATKPKVEEPILSKITKSQLEKRLEANSNLIFTEENLGSITYFLQSLIPYPKSRVGSSEFETIVINAEIDGMQKLINLAVKKILKEQ